MINFAQLSLSAPLKSNLAKHGFVQPTPVQARSIPPALAGRDLVATAQTGTGKTLAFVLPVIHRLEGQPSRYGSGRSSSAPHANWRCKSTRPSQRWRLVRLFARHRRGRDRRAKATAVDPKRRSSAHRHSGKTIRFPRPPAPRAARRFVLVLDEADRMLDMGFLPTIRKIMAAMPPDRQTLFFSATIETSVKHP